MQAAILLVGCLSIFLSVFASSALSIALPSIMDEFHVTHAVSAWVVASYMMFYAALMPLTGYLSDRFSKKGVYLTGMIIFMLGTLLAMAIPGFEYLIAARSLQGVGAASMFPPAASVIKEVFSSRSGRAMGIISASAGIGVLLGPLAGGHLLEVADYRAIFFIMLPIAAISFVIGSFSFPSKTKLAEDLPLAKAPVVIKNPFYRDFGYIAVIAMVVCQSFVIYGAMVDMPAILIREYHYTTAQTGIMSAFFPLAMMIAAPAGGYLADKRGYRMPVVLGTALLVMALPFLSMGFLYERITLLLAFFMVLGASFGISISPLTLGSMEHASCEDAAKASGIFGFSRQAAGSAGAALTPLLGEGSLSFVYLTGLILAGLIAFIGLNKVRILLRDSNDQENYH